MGAVRFRNEFYSHHNERYRIDIWDSDYAGSIITTIPCVSLEWRLGSEGDALCESVKASEVRYVLMDDGSGDFIAFESDLAQAQENEFKLIIYKYSAGSPVLFWAGVIMVDLVEYENRPVPREFEIIAKDGLNRAANIEFTKINASPYISGGVSTPQNFMKIIFDCLSYTETAQFWNGSGVPYIRVCTSWTDVSQGLDNSSAAKYKERLLECIRIDRDFMFDHDFDDKGQGWTKDEHWKWLNQWGNPHLRLRSATDPALKARTILRELLQLLNLRIMLSNGSWYIIQFEQYQFSALNLINYDYLGAYSSRTAAYHIRQTPDSPWSGGRFGYFPSLRSVRASIKPSDILNLTTSFNKVTIDEAQTTYTNTIELGDLYGGVGSGLKLDLGFDIKGYNNFGYFVGRQFDCEVTYQFVGTDDASTDWAFKYVNKWNAPTHNFEWTNTPADTAVFSARKQAGSNLSTVFIQDNFQFITTELPFDIIRGAQLIVSLRMYNIVDNSTYTTGAGGPNVPKLYFKNPAFKLLNEGDELAQISEYELINPDLTIGNSFDLDLGKLRVHDTGVISGKNSIEVDEYVGASRWTKSTNWEAGHDTDRSLIYSVLRENMAFQRKPTKKYTGDFLAPDYYPHLALEFDSSYWVFHSGSFNFYTDSWESSVWWKIARNHISVAEPTILKNQGIGEKGQVNPVGKWMPPDISNANFPVKGATINGGIPVSGGAVTSIGVFALAKLGLRNGDRLLIVDPIYGSVINTITVDGVTEENDTTIPVQSFTPSEDIHEYYEVSTNNLELSISEEHRSTSTQSLGEGYSYTYSKVLKATTSGNTTTELTTNGLTGSGALNRIVIDTDTAVTCLFTITVKRSGSANCGTLVRRATFYNNGGTTALQGSAQTIGTDEIAVTIAAITTTISANNTNDCLKIEVNGMAATNLEWTCRVDLTVSKYA